MVYACETCGLVFCRVGDIIQCPFCEKANLRPATEQEKQQLAQLIKKTKVHNRLEQEGFR
ncbi:MAG: hypothetical protein RRX92_09450 [Lachnospiraceae bacterium]